VYVPFHPAVAFRTESPATTLSPEGTNTLTAEAGKTYTDVATNTTYTIPSDLLSNALIGDLGAAGYQIVAFEDMFPDTGDYDFNDVVVAHRLHNTLDSNGNVVAISGDAYLVARGAGGYNHRWSLDIPLTGATVGAYLCNVTQSASSTEIANSDTLASTDALACKVVMANGSTVARIVGFRDTRSLLPNMNTLVSDSPSLGSVPHMNFSIALSAPVATSAVGTASPWIEISRSTQPMAGVAFDSSAYKVTLASRDLQNKPYAMQIPSDWQVPVEGNDIGEAYPQFANFVTSGGASNANWYQSPDQRKVVGWRVKDVAQ
jgi:LruC domain-containing protein